MKLRQKNSKLPWTGSITDQVTINLSIVAIPALSDWHKSLLCSMLVFQSRVREEQLVQPGRQLPHWNHWNRVSMCGRDLLYPLVSELVCEGVEGGVESWNILLRHPC